MRIQVRRNLRIPPGVDAFDAGRLAAAPGAMILIVALTAIFVVHRVLRAFDRFRQALSQGNAGISSRSIHRPYTARCGHS